MRCHLRELGGWGAKQLQPRAAQGRWGVTSPVTGRPQGEAPLGPIFYLAVRLLGVPWHCLIEPKSKSPRRRWWGIKWLAAAVVSLPCPAVLPRQGTE